MILCIGNITIIIYIIYIKYKNNDNNNVISCISEKINTIDIDNNKNNKSLKNIFFDISHGQIIAIVPTTIVLMKTPPPSKAEIAMRMLLSSDIDATSEKKSGAPLPNAII